MSGNSMQILALIPARGGSRGIPRKNILPIAGQPLIAYTIAHAKSSHFITRTIVSTDNPEIADIAKDYGAEIPFLRPAEYAKDLSPDIDVFKHALKWLGDCESYHPDLIVHLRPTGPVRKVELIDKAIEFMLNNPQADSLRSISWPIQTPYKMWCLNSEGFLSPLLRLDGIKEAHSMPRQMLPEVFWQNGYVDIVRPKTILEKNSMTGEKILGFVVNEPIFEIDYPESIPEVEKALKKMASGESFNTVSKPRYHPV